MNSLVGMNVFCCWPNGENKNVVVTGIDGDHAVVIWNENHSPMGELGCVVGCDARVPLEWLRVPYSLLAAAQGRERKLREALEATGCSCTPPRMVGKVMFPPTRSARCAALAATEKETR